jgi:signal recognition particle subunit SEC65
MKPCQAAIAGAVIVESAALTKVAKAVKRIDASCKLPRRRETPSQLLRISIRAIVTIVKPFSAPLRKLM